MFLFVKPCSENNFLSLFWCMYVMLLLLVDLDLFKPNIQIQNQFIHSEKLCLLLVPTPLHCCSVCGTVNSSIQAKRRAGYPGKWGVELIVKELLPMDPKTSSDPSYLLRSHPLAGNHSHLMLEPSWLPLLCVTRPHVAPAGCFHTVLPSTSICRSPVWTSESAAGAASWALCCTSTVVGESEMPVSPGGCTVGPEWGGLAGSNQLHAEPMRGTTAHVH